MNIKNSKLRREGYTLIELLVAIGLFGVVTAIAVGGFARALRTQRQAQLLLVSNGNVSEAIEGIARELRVARDFQTDVGGFGSTCFGVVDGAPAIIPLQGNALRFKNPKNEDVIYRACNNRLERGLTAGGKFALTVFKQVSSGSVKVQNLEFSISGNKPGSDVSSVSNQPDGYPPRITIKISVAPNSDDPGISGSAMSLQTTVSARLIDDQPPALRVRKFVQNTEGTAEPKDFMMAVVGNKVRPCTRWEDLTDAQRGNIPRESLLVEPGTVEGNPDGGACRDMIAPLMDNVCYFRGSEEGTIVTLAEGAFCVDELPNSSYEKFFDDDCRNSEGHGSVQVGETKTCSLINVGKTTN
ncbi:MAG: prepilin-type N-terminal cleavage/methylation domain-containing protein [Patescibacteria group bacterium]|nr:prepilin-type N-terminal cleavage/methylation domain-containing protein [Patescibacteria group bacterium]